MVVALGDFFGEVVPVLFQPVARIQVGFFRAVGNGGEIADAEIDASGFIQQQQVAAIPKASSRAHLQANLSVFDFELTEEEMAQIFDLQGGLIDRVRSVLGL